MKVGFVGLGIMGKPMSRNLIKAGHELVVFDLFAASVEEIVASGAARGASAADVAARSEIVVTMLPDGPEVEAAVLGAAGVLEGAQAGTIVVDMSSISPLAAQKVGAACEAKGVEFLDAPVSGGEPKAIDQVTFDVIQRAALQHQVDGIAIAPAADRVDVLAVGADAVGIERLAGRAQRQIGLTLGDVVEVFGLNMLQHIATDGIDVVELAIGSHDIYHAGLDRSTAPPGPARR